MTAYAAVNSLRNTIDYILHSSHFSLVDPSPHIIQLAYDKLDPLQEILEGLDRTRTSKSRKKVNGLDGRIKELIWEFQHLLESLLYQQIHSQIRADQVDDEMTERVWEFGCLLESLPSQPQILRNFNTPRILNESQAEDDVGGERIRFSIDLHCIEDDVGSFMERLKDMEREYIYEVDNMLEDDDDEDDQSISTRSGTKSKMIGLSDQFQLLKRGLMQFDYDKNNYITLDGAAGLGKTALAEAVFEDPEILSHFEYRAWVTVGRKSRFDDVSRGILAQMFGITQGDHGLGVYLKERLEGKKCLVVLDDVWETQIWDSLMSSIDGIDDGSIHILITQKSQAQA
ncbi:disease resistance protein RPP13-like isoform X2 [Salvia miltiorrhiza]|uniref:disease resistance protein RPP13-like isoform X2 n=1 Tax=Salvia miltiorrhiza TaxID=226208 RepID=UPI0025AD18AB|nr:disease resistance protein RPP13-like isoform X2 [Salvia miltiorrhiza]XP_057789296.1 disease resistance protein RPP13-like isoform X2 [Salvia miltiorrhiza]